MKYKDVSKSLRRIANKTLTQDDLEQQIIIQKGNTYQAYGAYSIEETPLGWQVTTLLGDEPLIFNTAKVALAWCIACKAGNHVLANKMQFLDSQVNAKQIDVDVLTHMLEHVNKLDDRAILLARLTEDINNRQIFKKQLAGCVDSAKALKLKKRRNK